MAELERGVDLAAQQPTVAQWCQTWLEAFAINLKPNIKEDYAAVVQRYIADSYAMTEAAKALVYNVARDIGPDRRNRVGTDAAKLFAAVLFSPPLT